MIAPNRTRRNPSIIINAAMSIVVSVVEGFVVAAVVTYFLYSLRNATAIITTLAHP